jgi:hypothetical protein
MYYMKQTDNHGSITKLEEEEEEEYLVNKI